MNGGGGAKHVRVGAWLECRLRLRFLSLDVHGSAAYGSSFDIAAAWTGSLPALTAL